MGVGQGSRNAGTTQPSWDPPTSFGEALLPESMLQHSCQSQNPSSLLGKRAHDPVTASHVHSHGNWPEVRHVT
jgi:hypothetical protein